MPANSPIYSFRWASTGMVALISHIRMAAWTVTAFSGGLATFDLFAARSFTAADGGGLTANLAGENNQLRTSMASGAASIGWSNTNALTPGTRVLDGAPLDSRTFTAPTTDNTPFPADQFTLFYKPQGEYPLYLAANEGFVIRASVPSSTSTWQFAVTLEWAELLPGNF